MARDCINRLKDSHGQSVIIEYASIAILIILGILVIGPYVVRSVNAYFKTAEEQAHESFREEIQQADFQD
jgi:Flp pilus assembly pilin Flp